MKKNLLFLLVLFFPNISAALRYEYQVAPGLIGVGPIYQSGPQLASGQIQWFVRDDKPSYLLLDSVTRELKIDLALRFVVTNFYLNGVGVTSPPEWVNDQFQLLAETNNAYFDAFDTDGIVLALRGDLHYQLSSDTRTFFGRFSPVYTIDGYIYTSILFGPDVTKFNILQWWRGGADELSYELFGEQHGLRPIPEPASASLLLLGGAGWLMRRRYFRLS